MKIAIADKKHIKEVAEILFKEWYDSLKEAKEEAIKRINNKECLIALENNKVVGILMYSRDYSHYANYCQDLFVVKEYRNKGIASLLLKKFIYISRKEQPRKQKYVLSSTDTKNIASIRLHKRVGFNKIGTVKYLHYGKDEVFFGYRL